VARRREGVRTSYRAPNAPARAARATSLPYPLGTGEAHLRRAPTAPVACSHRARPHQGLEQRCPVALPTLVREEPVHRRDRLGVLLHDYYRAAA
jgi:hypothetical protein